MEDYIDYAKICYSCSTSCLDCDGPYDDECLSCQSGLVLVEKFDDAGVGTTSECKSKCPQEWFYKAETNQCFGTCPADMVCTK